MKYSVERSVQLFKQTQGPLRCLSDRDPCNRHKSILRKPNNDKPKTQTLEDQE